MHTPTLTSKNRAELRPRHQRLPILHHDRADAVPERQTCRLRQGRRRHGRGAEGGECADDEGEAESGHQRRAVRGDVSTRSVMGRWVVVAGRGGEGRGFGR